MLRKRCNKGNVCSKNLSMHFHKVNALNNQHPHQKAKTFQNEKKSLLLTFHSQFTPCQFPNDNISFFLFLNFVHMDLHILFGSEVYLSITSVRTIPLPFSYWWTFCLYPVFSHYMQCYYIISLVCMCCVCVCE